MELPESALLVFFFRGDFEGDLALRFGPTVLEVRFDFLTFLKGFFMRYSLPRKYFFTLPSMAGASRSGKNMPALTVLSGTSMPMRAI